MGEVLYLGLDPKRQELGSGESETGRGKANKGAHGVEAAVGNWDSVPWGETSEESCRTHVASFSPLTAVLHRLRVAPESINPSHLPTLPENPQAEEQRCWGSGQEASSLLGTFSRSCR